MAAQFPFEFLLLTSSVGALQSAFFGIYLFSKKNVEKDPTVLLALLLLVFAIRMTKSVSYYFAEDHQIPILLQNIGYAAHIAILPLLWLYLNAFLNKTYRPFSFVNLIQLSPSILIILLSPVLSSHFWISQNIYGISLVILAMYLPASFYLIYINQKTLDHQQKKWVYGIIAATSIVWLAYMANYLVGWVSYITAPVLFSFAIYPLSYWGLKHPNLFSKNTRYKSSVFSAEEIDDCFQKIQSGMKQDELYKNPDLTLPKLAKHLSVSPNLLSQSVNEKAGINVPDFINSYRIKEAQKLLTNPNTMNQKIASIAFDTGFNALSAFNTAFKKFTGTTPSEYRKKQNL